MNNGKMMNYKETVDFLYARLPMFHREGKTAYKANLDNIVQLASTLGNPENKFKSIHVAGTNGKGSVCHMLASILQHEGYKTGLYTSPHLLDFRERIRVNGEVVPEEFVVNFIEQNIHLIDDINPSFFEMTTAMAFNYFANSEIDIAVVETGLGGRLDATNIITPLISVITNISFDHTDILGNTLEAIAGEKAGIIKKGVPVVIGESNESSDHVFIRKADQAITRLEFADSKYSASIIQDENYSHQTIKVSSNSNNKDFLYELDLLGNYQGKNLVTVLSAIDILNQLHSGLYINEISIQQGLKNVIKSTGLLGRWQIFQRNPLIILDTGHNEEGIRTTARQLKKLKFNKLHIVFGMVKEKDIRKILSLLPKNAIYYFTKASIPRALDENTILEESMQEGLKGNAFPSIGEAIKKSFENSRPGDCIYIGGSTFVVAEALLHINNLK
jgi:dihydrofolate synthase / folylpolyglutamate synthase